MKIKRFNQMNEELDLTEKDLVGGLELDEYKEIIDYVKNLERKADKENPFNRGEELTDDEKIISEILYNITTKPERGYDYNTYYHRRKGFVSLNKNKANLN